MIFISRLLKKSLNRKSSSSSQWKSLHGLQAQIFICNCFGCKLWLQSIQNHARHCLLVFLHSHLKFWQPSEVESFKLVVTWYKPPLKKIHSNKQRMAWWGYSCCLVFAWHYSCCQCSWRVCQALLLGQATAICQSSCWSPPSTLSKLVGTGQEDLNSLYL